MPRRKFLDPLTDRRRRQAAARRQTAEQREHQLARQRDSQRKRRERNQVVHMLQVNVPEETKEEDSTVVSISGRSIVQQNKFFLCCGKNDDHVVEKHLLDQTVQSTFSVTYDTSNIRLSDESSGGTMQAVSPLQYKCAKCLRQFSTLDLLLRHVFSHELCVNRPLYICKQCGEVFLKQFMLYAHNFHHSEKTASDELSLFELECAVCEQTLSWCSLVKHAFSHVSAISTPSYVCKYCSEVFEDMAKLHFHKYGSRTSQIRTYHDSQPSVHTYELQLPTVELLNNSIDEELVNSYSCSNSLKSQETRKRIQSDEWPPVQEGCQNLFMRFYCLEMYQKCHTSEHPFSIKVSGSSFTDTVHLNSNRSNLDKRPYTCEVCDKSFTQLENFEMHWKMHLGERTFYCKICGKSYLKFGGLRRHLNMHSRVFYFSCKDCGKSFSKSWALKKHQRIHLEKRIFSCVVCGKSFIKFEALKRHQKIHSRILPFSCDICEKSFANSWALKTHQRYHLDKRSFSCEFCRKSFLSYGDLQMHRRNHSYQYPFYCKVCEKSFANARGLKIHAKSHFGKRPFFCDICGKCFKLSIHLKWHQRCHGVERLFSCEVCGISFAQPDPFKNHLQIHSS